MVSTLEVPAMRVGARNRVTGKVTDIKKGNMCLVKLEVPAHSRMASVMTLESLDELGIQKGDDCRSDRQSG